MCIRDSFSIAGGRILTLMNEPEMKGDRDVPESGDITFDHVYFGYQEKEILHDISVTLRKGTLTALVGPSGSGKSTMLKLCARFYDPRKGSVRFNGMDMKELEPESLMKHCSMVFQDVYLFQDCLLYTSHTILMQTTACHPNRKNVSGACRLISGQNGFRL